MAIEKNEDQYQRIIEIMHRLGHDDVDEYEIIQRVAHNMKIHDQSEEDALDQIEAYYLESLNLLKEATKN